MKGTKKRLLAILTILMCFVAVQNVSAETFTIEGEIQSISTKPNVIVIKDTNDMETAVNGVKFSYLCNQYSICLTVDDVVSIVAEESVCKDGTTKLIATSITVGEATITLR